MARMYAVDRRVYIGEEARPMYNASVFGLALYYVPADDLAALGRRRLLSQAIALMLFVVPVVGVLRGTWSVWWLASALAASPLAAAFVGRFVREGYQPVTNPAVLALVHQRVFQDSEPIIAVLMYFAMTFPDTARWIQRTGGWSVLGVTLAALALQLAPLLIRSHERKRLEIEGHAS